MMDRRRSGGVGLLAVLLLLLVVAGAWNFYRNLAAERAVHRPFQSYADTDLEVLTAALQVDSRAQATRYEVAANQRSLVGKKGYFDEQVAEFERVQRVGDTKRRAQRDLAGSRVTLRLLEEERGYRVREEKPVSVFLERLLTL